MLGTTFGDTGGKSDVINDLTDPVWQHAESATNLFRSKEGIAYPAELNTEVRVIYDEDVFYNGVHCEEQI